MITKLRNAGLLWPTLMTAIALPILIGLGQWQLQRMSWKEGLIAAIDSRSQAPPADLLQFWKNLTSAGTPKPAGIDYVRVRVRGTFHHDKELFYYAPDQRLGPGYHVYTPLEIAGDHAIVFVNRGYVPEANKAPSARTRGQLAGEVEVIGLLRAPGVQGRFTPDNEPQRNLWFWRDFAAMFATAFANTERPYLPAFIDAEGTAPGGWPKGGVTIVELPNRHLEYAITWFGLAVVLAVIYAIYALGRLRSPH